MSEDEIDFFIDSLRGGSQALRVKFLQGRHRAHGIRRLRAAITKLKEAAVRRGIPIYVSAPTEMRAQSRETVVSVRVELTVCPVGLRRGCFGEE